MGQYKGHSAEFKAKVALEAIKGQRTLNEIAGEYGVHPGQIIQWKKQVPEELPGLSATKRSREAKADEELKASLYQQIGQLKVELHWFSRYVLSWEVSVNLDVAFCLDALDRTPKTGAPEIFNSDQGCQFTSQQFTERLLSRDIRISIDETNRALDNVFVERLWRTVKQEEVYIKDHQTVPAAIANLGDYFQFYNSERLHQSLGYRTPEAAYRWLAG